MTVRPWWRDGQLIDLPGALVSVGEEAGLCGFPAAADVEGVDDVREAEPCRDLGKLLRV